MTAAEPARSGRTGANIAELTVSELSSAIKRSLEDGFGFVRLRGEISGYRGPHASGHCYFALKDDKAKIEAVIWRGNFARLRFKPEEGLEVVAQGKITSFPGASKYQIVVETLEPAGVGALMALLEERKRKLGAEGLFDEGRRRPLPFLPRVVGIVTSPTGAVIRDMLAGFTERFPTRVLLWPVRVQGETSATEVAAAIRGFNALPPDGPLPRPDVLIVARGGGSLEDLWGFNEEVVVRAAAASDIPLISAVGHETDWTLIDLAADARAPTPTKAAEWAVPKHSELMERTGDLGLRLMQRVRRLLEEARAHWRAAARGLPRPVELTALPRQRFDAVDKRLGRALMANTQAHARRLAEVAPRLHPRLLTLRIEREHTRLERFASKAVEALSRSAARRRLQLTRVSARLSPDRTVERISRATERLEGLDRRQRTAFAALLTRRRQHLEAQGQMLASLSYHSVLGRGFALIRDSSGRAVRTVHGLKSGMAIDLELAGGHAGAVVTDTGGEEASERATPEKVSGTASTSDRSPTSHRAATDLRIRPSPRRRASGNDDEEQGSLF
ncbi:MAG: exodeoxyribonuclease VII large subunit [Hyphomicrobiaceae bacterium]